jgi:hypothetical protein
VLQGLIGAGVVDPWNALVTDWADAMDIDPTNYLVPPPPAPPMPPQGAMPPEGAAEPPPEGAQPEQAPPPGGPLPQVPGELNPRLPA